VPEGYFHQIMRAFLFQLLQFVLGEEHTVNSDQFVYWDASSPRSCLAPDVCVRLNMRQSIAGTWKVWERGGPPELAVEIVSPSEDDGIDWDEKLRRYHALGVGELVRFDPEAPRGSRIRVWDRVKDDLVERHVEGEATHCATLRLTWAIRPMDNWPEALRLLDAEGNLVLSRVETAEARVRELEEELRRRRG